MMLALEGGGSQSFSQLGAVYGRLLVVGSHSLNHHARPFIASHIVVVRQVAFSCQLSAVAYWWVRMASKTDAVPPCTSICSQ